MPHREQLRARLKAVRADLDPEARAAASDKICRALIDSEIFQAAKLVAAYLPLGAEASPLPAIEAALTGNKKVYVPIIRQRRPPLMDFARLRKLAGLKKNRFGIEEPAAEPDEIVAASDLDLVLAPLVAFDERGNRLGMGGGFYDRCFSFKQVDKRCAQPVLCGLAFDCQRVAKLAAENWDIPLDCVATESGIITFHAT